MTFRQIYIKVIEIMILRSVIRYKVYLVYLLTPIPFALHHGNPSEYRSAFSRNTDLFVLILLHETHCTFKHLNYGRVGIGRDVSLTFKCFNIGFVVIYRFVYPLS